MSGKPGCTARIVHLAVGGSLAWQGRVADDFVDEVVDMLVTYLLIGKYRPKHYRARTY